jgi:hypothetical protein
MNKHMEIEIEILGADFVFDVEYHISSYGTHDTWDFPGDPPELYIEQITNKRTGEDMTQWCNTHHDWWNKEYKPWVQAVHRLDHRGKLNYDSIEWLLFHRPTNDFLEARDKLAYRMTLEWQAYTWLTVLEGIIYQREEFDEGGDKGGYD